MVFLLITGWMLGPSLQGKHPTFLGGGFKLFTLNHGRIQVPKIEVKRYLEDFGCLWSKVLVDF